MGVSADVATRLRDHGIRPSAQRVAIARYVLSTGTHPSADEVWARVVKRFPTVSRATVYNTLNAFVEAGLPTTLEVTQGRTVFDPNIEPHHHFVDDATGRIQDVPWEAVEVRGVDALPGIDVRDYQVVIRGRRRR